MSEASKKIVRDLRRSIAVTIKGGDPDSPAKLNKLCHAARDVQDAAADHIEALERDLKDARSGNRYAQLEALAIKRAEAAEAREARLSEALRSVRADCQAPVDLYHRVGPSFRSPGGDEYEPASYVMDKMQELITRIDAALSGSGSGWRGIYRLLETTDTIQAGDEVIDDDGVTWCPVDRWSIGCEVSRLFKSIRRALPAAPQQGGE